MPLIVYKTMRITAQWAQIRRVRCGHCPNAYSYVTSARKQFETTGIPVISADASMRKALSEQLKKRAASVARKQNVGMARCPACGFAQPWMTRRVVVRAVLWGLLWTLLAFLPALFLGAALYQLGGEFETRSIVSWIVLGLGIATAMWFWARSKIGSRETPDVRSMRDGDLTAFLAECAEGGIDPALYWWFEKVERRKPAQNVVLVSLGMNDFAGGFDVPASLHTAHRIAEI